MKVYLAGKFFARFRLRERREQLRSMGYEVSSTWLDQPYDVGPGSMPANHEAAVEEATRDLQEVHKADLFILDTLDESNTGGREVELGYAEAQGLWVIIVGPRRNVFHTLYTQYNTWEEALLAIHTEERESNP